MVSLLPALALAAPTFTGDPGDVSVAAAAWDAAAVCTGRPGRAHDEVEIRHRTIMGGYLGVAHTLPDGTLTRIDLNTEAGRNREVLVHEVAHAWVSEGPIALVEGAAELLADCIVARVPGLAPLQYDDGRPLSGLQDLRGWAAPDAHTTESLGSIRTDAYLGAARMMRVAAMVVPRAALWPEDGLTWDGFTALLQGAGPRAAPLLSALHGGAKTQRDALADGDLDGLPRAAEALFGTSDAAFDTDGDGWWDGAADVPEGAVQIPMDGTPVCTGWATAGFATVRLGGNLRGNNPQVVRRRGARGSVLVALQGPPEHASGAAWALVRGPRRVADTACQTTARATVWSEDAALAGPVAALGPALERALDRVASRFGPLPTRLAVRLGGDHSTVRDGIVVLSERDTRAALATGQTDALANLAAAVHHLWSSGERSWPAAQAVARSLGR